MKKRSAWRSAGWYIAVVAISIATTFPLIWTLATSLKTEAEIATGGFSLLPQHITIENYREVFRQVPFTRYFVNSLIIGVGGAAANIFLGSLAGYAFARLEFRFKKTLFWGLISSMMVPSIVTMIPLFLVLRHFPLVGGNDILGQGGVGMINTFWAVILPGAAGAYAVFMMRQHFADLPSSLAEAARIDGASEWRIFSRIYLPLVKPGLATLAILTFQAGWNNFLWPLIVLSSRDKMTIQVGLAAFRSQYETSYGPLMAGTIIACIPVLLVFVIGQRWIVEGATTTGIKE